MRPPTAPARALIVTIGMVAASFAAAIPARAQEIRPNLGHPCQDFAFLTRKEIYDCLQADYARADAELNRAYQKKLAGLTPAAREKLVESQRAWLRRYDQVLTLYYQQPWSAHSMVKVLPSQIRAVRDRTAWVEAFRA